MVHLGYGDFGRIRIKFTCAGFYDGLVTDFNKRITTVFDALFRTSARHFDALHIYLLACLMRDLAEGEAQKNPCNGELWCMPTQE